MKRILFFLLSALSTLSSAMQPPKLRNYGATCFQNATIQALYAIDPITNFLVANPNPYPENSLPYYYTQLVKLFKQQAPQSTAHYALLQQLGVAGYQVVERCTPEEGCKFMQECRHEDASEFMAGLLDGLMADDQNFQNISQAQLLANHPIGQLIAIGRAERIACPSINFERTRVTPTAYLTLEAQGVTSLDQALQTTFAIEQLNDPQYYYRLDLTDEEALSRPDLQLYDDTLIPNCTKKTSLAYTNEIVIIALKRFAYNIYGQQIKLNHTIAIPSRINFGPFMVPTAAAQQPDYDLIGAIHHSGRVTGGHYVAYVKYNGQWYYCNDERIQRTNLAAIQNSINTSYVLIYQRHREPPTAPPAPDLAQALRQLTEALDGLYVRLGF